jgi:integrase/recombinase XerD
MSIQPSVQLLELGLQLMEASKPISNIPIRKDDAVRYRDGLMIGLLAFTPLRCKNLAALENGRHLVRERDGWGMIIPREETKTGTPIEFAVPELLESYLAIYLDVVRPRLLGHPTCSALWVNARGEPLAYAAIGDVISRHSTRRLGFRITPHDVRDAAATTWALSAPDQIGIARDLLAHSASAHHYQALQPSERDRSQPDL